MEERIVNLPEVVSNFHTQATRIIRELMSEANELRATGYKNGWFFRAGVAESIQNARFHGLMYEADNTSIWSNQSVWEVLVQFCRRSLPEKPADALWLYVAAYEFDNVYLPIPDEIIDGTKDNPKLLAVICDHASKMFESGWAETEERQTLFAGASQQFCRN